MIMMYKISALTGLAVLPSALFAQHLLPIPDTLSGTGFTLNVHQDSVQFFPGAITHTLGVNASKYLGPTLILRKGDSVNITVDNHIGDTTTMHWHGLHVAPKNDGGPMSAIADGASWQPGFTVRNDAGTYWYHPHPMMKTAGQAIKGDAGLIIVRDAAEQALPLPRTYGVDDFPLIVQSFELDTEHQFMPRGMVDSIVMVNGVDSPYVVMPAQVVRLRLLNASGERTFNFGLSGNKPFSIIANDDGLLPSPVTTTRVWLSPGERVEVLLDLGSMMGQTIFLKSYASELPMGVQGGPTMPMPPWSPPMNSPLNGIDFNILQINVGAAGTGAITAIPSLLIPDVPWTESAANAARNITMSADSLTVMDGPFYFNNSMFDMMRIDYHIPLGNIEVWTLYDSTMVAHPFHMHDVHFYILDRDGHPPGATEQGKKDVVLVKPMEKVRLIMKFDDFADTSAPYMYHCHILMHEDDGMMGQFVVTPPTSVKKATNKPGTLIYPNPCSSAFHIIAPGGAISESTVRVTDVTGRTVYTGSFTQTLVVNAAGWPAGIYSVFVISETVATVEKVIIE